MGDAEQGDGERWGERDGGHASTGLEIDLEYLLCVSKATFHEDQSEGSEKGWPEYGLTSLPGAVSDHRHHKVKTT